MSASGRLVCRWIACVLSVFLLPAFAHARAGDAIASHTANVNGIEMRYLAAGAGGKTPVILLHGYAQTSHMWLPLIPTNAAGWRIEPPVSVPVAPGHRRAATAAELPPDEPPGASGALPPSLRGNVDVLIVNAPYVPTADLAFLPTEAREHEPRLALDGGADGVEVHRRVAADASGWLAPDGVVLTETSRHQCAATIRAFLAVKGGTPARLRTAN